MLFGDFSRYDVWRLANSQNHGNSNYKNPPHGRIYFRDRGCAYHKCLFGTRNPRFNNSRYCGINNGSRSISRCGKSSLEYSTKNCRRLVFNYSSNGFMCSSLLCNHKKDFHLKIFSRLGNIERCSLFSTQNCTIILRFIILIYHSI